jgi:hypothetical protein
MRYWLHVMDRAATLYLNAVDKPVGRLYTFRHHPQARTLNSKANKIYKTFSLHTFYKPNLGKMMSALEASKDL